MSAWDELEDDGLTVEQAEEMHEREAAFADEEPY